MSKREKMINRLLKIPSDFKYDELSSLLNNLGYIEDNRGRTSGSRVAFIQSETGQIIRLHKPHPGNILKRYQIEQLVEELKRQGVIRS